MMGQFTIDLSWDAFARLMMLNQKIEGQKLCTQSHLDYH
jgi:hypothetical protein